MKSFPYISFTLLALSFLALVILAIAGNVPSWAWFIPIGVGIMATMTIFRGVFMPQNAVASGMELIQAQDYNNRLVTVGEPNADKIVTLFNSLIDKLRAERLQNREQESLLSLLIEASPMGIMMLDFDNKITLANKALPGILGFKNIDDIIGKNVKHINNEFISEITKIPLGSSEIIRKGYFKIYRVYHLNFIQQGFKREFFLIESMTEEILKAEKTAYEKVIRTISHEVNNTLGGIGTVLEVVIENSEDSEIVKVAESCVNRCDSLGNFIKEYAEVVKLPEPMMKPIDIDLEIANFKPFLRSLISPNIELRFNKSLSPVTINGDWGLLQQVLINIVKNASESIAGEGKIDIDIKKEEDTIILSISNNGAPIDDKTKAQLFTPFFTTKPEGKGIGLTLIRDVLNKHNAEYSLFTDTDGLTKFVIVFKK